MIEASAQQGLLDASFCREEIGCEDPLALFAAYDIMDTSARSMMEVFLNLGLVAAIIRKGELLIDPLLYFFTDPAAPLFFSLSPVHCRSRRHAEVVEEEPALHVLHSVCSDEFGGEAARDQRKAISARSQQGKSEDGAGARPQDRRPRLLNNPQPFLSTSLPSALCLADLVALPLHQSVQLLHLPIFPSSVRT